MLEFLQWRINLRGNYLIFSGIYLIEILLSANRNKTELSVPFFELEKISKSMLSQLAVLEIIRPHDHYKNWWKINKDVVQEILNE